MSKKQDKIFRYSSFFMSILEKVLGSQFNVYGVDKIPKKPVLFVANHFTRFETLVVPYIIYKHTNRQVRCLVSDTLCKDKVVKNFIDKGGGLSVKHPKRNKIIVSDLVSGDYDWMIYPEGGMIKSKEIDRNCKFLSNSIGKIRTGSAVLAMMSELYRQDLIALGHNHLDFEVKDINALKNIDATHIVPINITYYPIRPGNNVIKKFASKFFKKLSKRVMEELEIEGNILLSSRINITFCDAINLNDYLKSVRNKIYKIPIIKHKTKANLVIKYFKHHLTRKFMEQIYSNTKINIDHIFSAIIFLYKSDRIKIYVLKQIIYLCAVQIEKRNIYRINSFLKEANLYKILTNEVYEPFDSIVELAKSLNVIVKSKDNDSYLINREKLNQIHDFHDIRLENTIQVIANEFFLLRRASKVVKNNINIPISFLKKIVFNKLLVQDKQLYYKDYDQYYDSKLSKNKDLACPLFLDGSNQNVAILLVHGYQSSPKEVEHLAVYLNKLGFKTYSVRLRGHGTSPINMKDITWQDWQESVQRGYAILRSVCPNIVIMGFSTGGLLSLITCSRNSEDIKAVVSINAALKLKDIRAPLVSGVMIWNDLLNKFKIKKWKKEYIEGKSENPSVNYPHNYFHGVQQLEYLMDECYNNLENVKVPSLIIYSDNDPIINNKGSKIIIKRIKSKIKISQEIKSNKHIIVANKNKDVVFDKIKAFLSKLNLV